MMIQRIQTLYLLIIAALMAVTLFSGLAWFAGDAGEFGLYAFGLKTAGGEVVQSTVYMGVLLALACALPGVLANSQFFLPITKGLMLRSARLLLSSRRPSSRYLVRYGHCSSR